MKFLNLKSKAGYLGAAVICATMMGLSGMSQAATTTTTTLTPSTYTPATTDNIAFTVRVEGDPIVVGPTPPPSGTVYFLVDGQVRKTAWINYSGTLVFHYSVNCAGNRTFSAIFTASGNPYYLASQSPNLTLTVLPGISIGPGGCGDSVW